uniref:Uncharacterized protein n=1 Tax=Ascaris lumbricoides TaxID=6252 RepID=A0A0M3IXS3_ASCLU
MNLEYPSIFGAYRAYLSDIRRINICISIRVHKCV